MGGEKLWGASKRLISVLLIAGAVYLSLKYLLPTLVPFIVAYFTASLIRPVSEFCRRHFRPIARLVSVLLVVVLFSLPVFGVYFVGQRLTGELGDFLVSLAESSDSPDSPISKIAHTADSLRQKIPILGKKSGVDLSSVADSLIRAGTEKATLALTNTAAGFIRALPSALLSFGVSVIALIYLVTDYGGAAKGIKEFLPKSISKKAGIIYRRAARATSGYFRAYLLLMLITFGELYLGLVILRVEYALLFASVIAVVDFLPVLGVGTVLIPWGMGALLLGNYRLGIGLFILYALIGIVRQLIEPKLMGNFIGTHPFVALLGVYTGLKLFGIFGMILAPIILHLVMALRYEGKETKSG